MTFRALALLLALNLLPGLLPAQVEYKKEWQTSIPTGGWSWPRLIFALSDQSYVISYDQFSDDSPILKVSSKGLKQWNKVVVHGVLADVEVANDGGTIIVAEDVETLDLEVVKLDNAGNEIWRKFYGGTGDDRPVDIVPSGTTGYVILSASLNSNITSSKTENSKGGFDYWILKIDNNGNRVWDKTIGTALDETPSKIFIPPSGNLILNGMQDSKPWLVTVDQNGLPINYESVNQAEPILDRIRFTYADGVGSGTDATFKFEQAYVSFNDNFRIIKNNAGTPSTLLEMPAEVGGPMNLVSLVDQRVLFNYDQAGIYMFDGAAISQIQIEPGYDRLDYGQYMVFSPKQDIVVVSGTYGGEPGHIDIKKYRPPPMFAPTYYFSLAENNLPYSQNIYFYPHGCNWVDITNDGILDFIAYNNYASYSSSSANVHAFTQSKTGDISYLTTIPIDFGGPPHNFDATAISLGDYNFDGYVDYVSWDNIYLNNKNKDFIKTPLSYANANIYSWGDVDQDGDMDFFMSGITGVTPNSVLVNDGQGNLLAREILPNEDVKYGDVKNESPPTTYVKHLYNTNSQGDPWPEYIRQDSADYDKDSDNDLLVFNGAEIMVYENRSTTVNLKPTVPTNLSQTITNDDVQFSWSPSTDVGTPAANISYNVYLRRGTDTLIAFNSFRKTGVRKIPRPGNAKTNTFTFKGLTVGSYYWSVQAVDASFQASLFATEKSFFVTNNPTNITLTSMTVAENISTTFGTLGTADIDPGETHSYTFVSGTGSTDNALFQISGAYLSAKAPGLNFESKALYNIRIRSTDNRQGFYEKTFVITATNVNEAATDILLSSSTLAENLAAGEIGTLSSNDQDVADVKLFILVTGSGDTNNGNFEIVGTKLRSKITFDFETKNAYSVRVQTDDQHGHTFQKAFAIAVANANDLPTDIQLSSTSIEEGKPVTTVLGLLTSTDQDAGETYTYSLVSGFGNNGSFSISNDQLLSGEQFVKSVKDSYSIKIKVTDSKAGTFDKEFQITITPATAVGTELTLDGLSFNDRFNTESSSVAVDVNVNGGNPPYTVTLGYNGIASTENEIKPVDLKINTTNTYEALITEDMMDEFGVEFFVKVKDADNSVKQTDLKQIYRSFTSTSAEQISLSGFGGTLKSYQIISIPFDLDDKNIQTTFDPAFPGKIYREDWRLIAYQNDQYVDYKGGLVKVDQGRSYWFNARAETQIKLTAGQVARVTKTNPFSVSLAQGWNLVGNPYPFDLDWDDVTAANPDRQLSELYIYNQEKTAYDLSNNLKKWSGGFIHAETAGALVFPVTLKKTAGGRNRNEREISSRTLDGDAWYLPLVLEQGEATVTYGGIGMHPDALESVDRYDGLTAPRFLQYAEFNSYHPEFSYPRFSRDVTALTEEHAWHFTFESNHHDGPAVLRWNNELLGSNSAQLMLYDVSSDLAVNMKTRSSYTFDPGGSSREFRIMFSRENKEILPERTALGNAYPNPASGSTSIPYKLAKGHSLYEVSITVYDVIGRQVARLQGSQQGPGFYEAFWNGTDHQGGLLPGGLYIYKLTVDNLDIPEQRKLLLSR